MEEKILKSDVIQIAQGQKWTCVLVKGDQKAVAFMMKLPSGREFGFQVPVDHMRERIFEYATDKFDLDAYLRNQILDHPDYPVTEVVRDGEYVVRKLFQLTEDIQPVEYDPEAGLNRLIMEAEQLGWREYRLIGGTVVVLSKEIAPKRNYSIQLGATTAYEDLRRITEEYNRDSMACAFASFYGGLLLETGDHIPKQWQELAEESFKALSALNEAANAVSSDNRFKKLWMRCGVTFQLSAWEYSEVCRGTSMGQQILKRKFDLGDCQLDGETYTPDNRGDAGEDEWEHGEFGYDY